jgi:A/G-specific adenine glycosylase
MSPAPRTPLPSEPSSPPTIDPAELEAVQSALLAWFAANRRDLPWRHTRDPYRILVSEVMLQQIQVSRAIPFYLAFIERFPTVGALAAAPLAEAIRVWGDLGRYRRVVNLHRAARLIVAEHGGQVPRDPDVLHRLPGIGPYTAGAVACFAFEDDTAFVDTNMHRVLHRIFVGVDVPEPTAGHAGVMGLARIAIPPGRGWDWNQGLMDFGALHCTARKPACGGCPVSPVCRAYPAIQTALAEQPRVTDRPQAAYRYEESNRFYRGRVLATLRDVSVTEAAADGIDLRDLGAQVREGFTDGDVLWLYGVVESLTKDGLAVAEERPIYDAGDDAQANAQHVRVRLP